MQNLGTLGGRESVAMAINDSGMVVGQSETTDQEGHAIVWTAATGMVDIGRPGYRSSAIDVNNSGQVLLREFSPSFVLSTYVWTAASGRVPLGTLGGAETAGTAINSSGAVGGYSTLASGARHPFMWTAGDGMVDLDPTSGTFGLVTAVNDAGDAAGTIERAGGATVAFFWSPSHGMIDIPNFGGTEMEAEAINDSGQVVGYGRLAGSSDEDGFVWSMADGLIDLGLGEAGDINNSGQIVGANESPTDGLRRAALWESYVADANANGIDDVLEVVGQPDAFADDNTPTPTYGSVIDANGHVVTISDEAAPDGVRIAVGGTGVTRSTLSVCGMTLKLAPGSEVVVTCGSLTVSVVSGAAEVTVGSGTVVVTVPQGATAKVTDLAGGSYRVDNLGDAGNVSVAVNGDPSVVAPHQTTTVSTGDTTPPQVQCANAPSFIIGQPGASVSATVSDGGSGPAASPVSAPANTYQVGSFSANVTGYDNAGNFATVACSYSVKYAFEGFSAPIDNLPVINTAKAGQAVPVKWRVTNYQGVGIADPASFATVVTVTGSCSSTAPFDAVEDYTGSSGLQYLGNGWWQYNWKTPKTYVNLCREMQLRLGDGTVHSASFKFK